MSISRRGFLQLTASGIAVAAIDLGDPVPADAAPTNTPVKTTLDGTVTLDPPGDGGYRRVSTEYGPGEPNLPRTDLTGGATAVTRPLAAFVQMTDLHIVDDQSPLRVEFLDQWADEGPPHFNSLPMSAAYRAHESMSTQVVDAMCRAIRRVGVGPRTNLPLAFTVVTGDAVDNCQYNEVRWFVDLLDGRPIVPNSGNSLDHSVTSDALGLDPHYWHPALKDWESTHLPPNGPGLDRNFQAGFPEVFNLPAVARRAFTATGLGMPWYSAYGNHDALVQGNVPIDNSIVTALAFDLKQFAVGGFKPSAIPGLPDNPSDVGDLFDIFTSVVFGHLPGVDVPADGKRRLLTRGQFIQEHFITAGSPIGHGFTSGSDQAYYVIPSAPDDMIRHIVLDTTYVGGGPNGWLSDAQYRWLENQLQANSSRYLVGDPELGPTTIINRPGVEDKLFVIYSHHTSTTMGNPLAMFQEDDAHNGGDLKQLLLRYPNVILWVNGHNHKNAIAAHARTYLTTIEGGFWEVTTASHIDWPYQSRIFEIGEGAGVISIFTTMVDIDAPLNWRDQDINNPATLASLSRELAANDLQQREHGVHSRPGDPEDRNTQLLVPTPFPFPAALAGATTTPITAVATAWDRLDVFAVAKDTRTMTNTWTSASGWGAWTHISNGASHPGGAGSPVTVANRYGQHLDAFTVGWDNHVWWAYSDTPGLWSPWIQVGTVTCSPGATVNVVVRDNNHMHLFTTASDTRIMTIAWDATNGWEWWGWQQLANGAAQPGSTVTGVSRYSSHIDVFAVGGDWHVWSSWWDVSTGVWAPWFKVGTITCRVPSTVSVVARDSNHLDLFTTRSDGAIMSSYWNPWTGWAPDWFRVQGGVASAGSAVTAISRYSNHLDLFTVGADNNIISAYWDASIGWGGWFTLGKGTPGGQVVAVSRLTDRLDVFTVGGHETGGGQITEGYVDTKAWDNTNGWQPNWTPVRAPDDAALATVPFLIGADESTARGRVTAAGLLVGTVGTTRVAEASDAGEVWIQYPPSGTAVRRGSLVHISLGVFVDTGGGNK